MCVMCFIWHTMCICVTSHAICVTCNVYNWFYLCIYIYIYVSAVAYMRSYTNIYVADWFGMPSSIAMSLPAGKWENHWGMFNCLVWWPEGKAFSIDLLTLCIDPRGEKDRCWYSYDRLVRQSLGSQLGLFESRVPKKIHGWSPFCH